MCLSTTHTNNALSPNSFGRCLLIPLWSTRHFEASKLLIECIRVHVSITINYRATTVAWPLTIRAITQMPRTCLIRTYYALLLYLSTSTCQY